MDLYFLSVINTSTLKKSRVCQQNILILLEFTLIKKQYKSTAI